jgi:predicted nuclease of predicted toxin-antitoxin system
LFGLRQRNAPIGTYLSRAELIFLRFIANENITATVVRELRRRGHDVLWVKEAMPKSADDAILAKAQSDERVVLTHDKDFGELAFRHGLPAASGILLIRLSGTDRQADIDQALRVIDSRDDWAGHFTVVSRGRLRMRPLPPSEPQRKPK